MNKLVIGTIESALNNASVLCVYYDLSGAKPVSKDIINYNRDINPDVQLAINAHRGNPAQYNATMSFYSDSSGIGVVGVKRRIGIRTGVHHSYYQNGLSKIITAIRGKGVNRLVIPLPNQTDVDCNPRTVVRDMINTVSLMAPELEVVFVTPRDIPYKDLFEKVEVTKQRHHRQNQQVWDMSDNVQYPPRIENAGPNPYMYR